MDSWTFLSPLLIYKFVVKWQLFTKWWPEERKCDSVHLFFLLSVSVIISSMFTHSLHWLSNGNVWSSLVAHLCPQGHRINYLDQLFSSCFTRTICCVFSASALPFSLHFDQTTRNILEICAQGPRHLGEQVNSPVNNLTHRYFIWDESSRAFIMGVGKHSEETELPLVRRSTALWPHIRNWEY